MACCGGHAGLGYVPQSPYCPLGSGVCNRTGQSMTGRRYMKQKWQWRKPQLHHKLQRWTVSGNVPMYRKDQLRWSLLSGLKALNKSFVQKIKLGLVNPQVDYKLFGTFLPASHSAIFEIKRKNLDAQDGLLGSSWNQLPLGCFVTRMAVKVFRGGDPSRNHQLDWIGFV